MKPGKEEEEDRTTEAERRLGSGNINVIKGRRKESITRKRVKFKTIKIVRKRMKRLDPVESR